MTDTYPGTPLVLQIQLMAAHLAIAVDAYKRGENPEEPEDVAAAMHSLMRAIKMLDEMLGPEESDD